LSGESKEFGSFEGYFNGEGPVNVVRVPARLDIMGGIADYSGSVVCEGLLREAVVLGLQRRNDLHVRIHSLGTDLASEGMNPTFEMSLDEFKKNGRLVSFDAARKRFSMYSEISWAGYIAGCFYTLMQEEGVAFDSGADIVLTSNIPLGAGISSSAAIEMAALNAANITYGLGIDGLQLAHLGQQTENRVVGAPCGLMDQISNTLGKEGHFLAIECQPDTILGAVRLPEGYAAVGINSKVKHAVSGSRYTDTRVAAFMGHRIILSLMQERGQAPPREDPLDGYLARISTKQFAEEFEGHLPSRITGREFLKRFGDTADPVTKVDPENTYYVRSRTSHPIYENSRVREFLQCLKDTDETGDEAPLVRAGKLMYGSHWSYRNRCELSCLETDLLVELAGDIGIDGGVYGAKITGGGAGGTVAVLGREDRIMESVSRIVDAYRQKRGIDADVFCDTSPGALEFGHIEYVPV
jgi:L-arabinokinase